MDRVKFSILTLYDDNYADFGRLTTAGMAAYAKAHGYGFVCVQHRLDTRLALNWSKFRLLEQELGQADWLVWMDADILIVDQQFQLESLLQPDKDMLLSTDTCGYCNGFFLLKSSAWAYGLISALRFVEDVSERPHIRALNDQDALKVLIDNFPKVSARCGGIPDSIVQNRESAYNLKAFANHYWANGLKPPFELILKSIEVFQAQGYTREAWRPTGPWQQNWQPPA